MSFSHDSCITPDEFRRGMRLLAGAVNVVATEHAGRRHGMTATAVCSVSAEPPTLLVCINRKAATHAAISSARTFSVNVLRTEDQELSKAFGGLRSGEERFRPDAWTRLATGAPVLLTALVAFDCEVVSEHSHGTHTLFLGIVRQRLEGTAGMPLVYANGRYAKLSSIEEGDRVPPAIDYWSM